MKDEEINFDEFLKYAKRYYDLKTKKYGPNPEKWGTPEFWEDVEELVDMQAKLKCPFRYIMRFVAKIEELEAEIVRLKKEGE